MRRRRLRSAVVLALAVVASGVAVHHASATSTHGGHEAPPAVAHDAHSSEFPPVPATDVEELMGVCLAVLPFLAALLLVAVAVLVLRRVMRVAVRAVAQRPPPPAPIARARPYVLCVMRC